MENEVKVPAEETPDYRPYLMGLIGECMADPDWKANDFVKGMLYWGIEWNILNV